MKLKIANYVLFQAGWLACVIGAAQGLPLAGLAVVAVFLAQHLLFAPRPGVELKLIAACAIGGGLFDTLLLATDWVAYPNGAWIPGAAPYWIVAMWVLFAGTLNLSLGWLKGRPFLAAALGAIGAPLAYVAGAELGAITLVQPLGALTMLAVGWALLMPAMAWLAARWNGFEKPTEPSWIQPDRRTPSEPPARALEQVMRVEPAQPQPRPAQAGSRNHV